MGLRGIFRVKHDPFPPERLLQRVIILTSLPPNGKWNEEEDEDDKV